MKLFLMFIFLSFESYCETRVFEGIAKREGQVVYFEKHTVVYEGETLIKSLIEYLEPGGEIIATLSTDHTHSLSAPEFILRDRRSKSYQGLHWQKGVVEMFSREGATAPVRQREFTPPADELLIAGPGLVYFVARHMNQIIGKNGLDFKYVIPGRFRAFDFHISPLAHTSDRAEFEVKIKSWLMSFFSPRLRLIYDVRSKRLLSFEGLSNIRDEDGSMMSVDINYLYDI